MSPAEPPSARSAGWAAVRWIAVAIFAAVQIHLAADDSPTADEPRHLRDGAAMLRDGRIDVNPEHPPLVKLLSAASIPERVRGVALADLPADPMASDARFWVRAQLHGAALLRARLPPITIAVAGVVAFGSLLSGIAPEAAALATVALAFSPPWLAQSHYVATDVAPIALLLIAAAIVRRRPTLAGALVAGVFLGAALVSKFSAPLLAPFLLLWIFVRARGRGVAAATTAALVVVLAVEAVAVRRMGLPDLEALSRRAFLEGGIGSSTAPAPSLARVADGLSRASRPAGAYAIGFLSIVRRSASAETADYWAGRIVAGPQPLYVLESLLIKDDLFLLAAAAWGAALLVLRRREAGPGAAIAVAAGVVYLTAACRSSMHWGSRYLLPLTVLFAGLAVVPLRAVRWRGVLAILAAGHVVVAALAFPNYVSYRNALAPRFVAGGTAWDFGEDWGQDLGRALASEKRPVRYLSLLQYWAPEWREAFPSIVDDDVDVPWLVDRLALNLTDAARRPGLPPSATAQLRSLQPMFERVDAIRHDRVSRPSSQPTLVIFDPAPGR